PRYLWHTVPGSGAILRLGLLYDIHDSARCASVQDVVSSWRLVPGAKASAGQRWGTSGKTIGHGPRTWALSDAATLVLRTNAAGPRSLARCEKKPGTGKAWTLVAPTLARAVYDRRQRHTAFARETFLPGEGAAQVRRTSHGTRWGCASSTRPLCPLATASLHAQVRRGRVSPSPGRCLDPCAGSAPGGARRSQGRGLPLSRT